MKNSITLFLCCFCINFIVNIKAQQLNGIWQSDDGNRFQIELNNRGFLCKDLNKNVAFQACCIGLVNGFPTYRSEFPDLSYRLFTIKSSDTITIISSYSPNVINTITKQNDQVNLQKESYRKDN